MADVIAVKAVAPPSQEPVVNPEIPALDDSPKTTNPDAKPTSVDSPSSPSPPLIHGSFRALDSKLPPPAGISLPDNEKTALDELKNLVRQSLSANDLLSDDTTPPPSTEALPPPETEDKKPQADESDSPPPADLTLEDETNSASPPQETVVVEKKVTEEEKSVTKEAVSDAVVSIWGIPLLADERSDVVLWKFLRARDFKVKEAFLMLKATLRWRKEFGIDEIEDEETGEWKDLEEKVVFMHGESKEGNPVCYNVYGGFNNKELYQKTFSDEENRQGFLRWRIRFLERSIRKLDFRPGGVSTIVQVNDLKDSPGFGKWELRQATKQALQLLQDNYPEFVAKQVFVNVPWWYMAVNKMISPFLTQRTKSKFVFAGPNKSAETLLNYIAAEQVPVEYGGLSNREGGEFSGSDAATHIIVKPSSKETVEFSVTEACQLTWEMRVLGWEVSYGAEFVPNAEDGYTVIIQKTRKITGNGGEGVISNSFKVGEPGKVILSVHNSTSKKKRLLYRLKSKPLSY